MVNVVNLKQIYVDVNTILHITYGTNNAFIIKIIAYIINETTCHNDLGVLNKTAKIFYITQTKNITGKRSLIL